MKPTFENFSRQLCPPLRRPRHEKDKTTYSSIFVTHVLHYDTMGFTISTFHLEPHLHYHYVDLLRVHFNFCAGVLTCGACRWRRRRRRSSQRWSAGSSRNLLRDVISAWKFLKRAKKIIERQAALVSRLEQEFTSWRHSAGKFRKKAKKNFQPMAMCVCQLMEAERQGRWWYGHLLHKQQNLYICIVHCRRLTQPLALAKPNWLPQTLGDCFQRKTWCMGSFAGDDYNSPIS